MEKVGRKIKAISKYQCKKFQWSLKTVKVKESQNLLLPLLCSKTANQLSLPMIFSSHAFLHRRDSMMVNRMCAYMVQFNTRISVIPDKSKSVRGGEISTSGGESVQFWGRKCAHWSLYNVQCTSVDVESLKAHQQFQKPL